LAMADLAPPPPTRPNLCIVHIVLASSLSICEHWPEII
jgi:hypothetical protein